MLPDDGKMIPHDYKVKAGNKMITLRNISLTEPKNYKLSEQSLDI